MPNEVEFVYPIELLREEGNCDWNLKTLMASWEQQLLLCASLAQSYEVNELLKRGADVNTKDEVNSFLILIQNQNHFKSTQFINRRNGDKD